MSLYRAEGIVLRNKNLGEADKIVTVFTCTHGKVRAVAKGARRPRNRLSGTTQLFSYSDFLFFSGKNLDNINQAYLKESFFRIRDDLIRMAYASYVAELLDLLVEEKAKSEELFYLLLTILRLLSTEIDLRTVTRFYELKLMDILGYRPELDSCVKCGTSLQVKSGGFSASIGGILCNVCMGSVRDAVSLSLGAIALMKYLLTVEPAKLNVLRISEKVHSEIQRALELYVRYRVERDIKSLSFLEIL